MFERCEQIRTQAPLLLANSIEIAALQQQCKKALSEIFRLFWFGALSPHEPVNRPPVRAAKLFQRRLCRWSRTLRLQDHAPMRCGKCEGSVPRACTNPRQ